MSARYLVAVDMARDPSDDVTTVSRFDADGSIHVLGSTQGGRSIEKLITRSTRRRGFSQSHWRKCFRAGSPINLSVVAE